MNLCRQPTIVSTALLTCALTLASGFAAAQATPVLPSDSSATVAGPDHARIEMQVQIQFEEGRLIAQTEARIAADRAADLVLDGHPLWLPLLAPVVGTVVLDHSVIPSGSQGLEVEASGGLKVERVQGGVRIVGRVPVNTTGLVRARLAISMHDPVLELGVTGRAKQTWLSLVAVAKVPARPTLTSSIAARISRFEQGGERLVGAVLTRPLRSGEIARFTFADLPVPAQVPRRALAWAAALLAIGVLAWLAVARLGRTDANS